MKLLSTFRGILNEVAARDQVIRAIQNKQIVKIYYDGDEPYGRGYRSIEPMCLGTINKSDGSVGTYLRAWEIEGASHTGGLGLQPLPGWRIFNLNKISSWNITPDKFESPRPGYNFNGDETFTTVFLNAKF